MVPETFALHGRPPVPLAATGLFVRWLHVLGAGVAVGGAVLAWASLRGVDAPSGAARTPESPVSTGTAGTNAARSRGATGPTTPLRVAAAYEWLFWGAAGVLVMTGVGNLGAFAPALPGGSWARTLSLKLLLVVGLLVGSTLRSLLVAYYRRADRPLDPTPLRRGYAATALVLVGIVALAEVLAHG